MADKPNLPSVAGQKEPTFIDSPHAPEVFSEGAYGFMLKHGNVHLTLTAVRVNHCTMPGPANRVVVGRVVLPVAGAQALAVGLYDFLKSMGVDPYHRKPGDTVQ